MSNNAKISPAVVGGTVLHLLLQALVQRCVQLLDRAETIKDLTKDHWWTRA